MEDQDCSWQAFNAGRLIGWALALRDGDRDVLQIAEEMFECGTSLARQAGVSTTVIGDFQTQSKEND